MTERKSQIAALLQKHEESVLVAWTAEQSRVGSSKISAGELKIQCHDFLRIFIEAIEATTATGNESIEAPAWEPIKRMLAEISKSRGLRGFSPSETAIFVFSLKRPVFKLLRQELSNTPQVFADETWLITSLLDQLGLYTTEAYQKTRDEVIIRQQEEMLELSTPVVKLWDGILALPMIGTLDSTRTQIVMDSLLQKIMETGSEIAIIDITGVPTVDTLVAQHLIKTVTAARLMGAECIISGIRPQIAATIVHLGVDLGGVTTKATLADAFIVALHRMGKAVGKIGTQNSSSSSSSSSNAGREIRA
ncbi:MAG: STAS domain-containing protein [Bdellovibrio sp.]|nr:STAS domain-containing protein [Bdellovibrio sp.]